MSVITDFDTNKTLLLLCSCKSEVLVLEHYKDDDTVDLCIYKNYTDSSKKISLTRRIRDAIMVLFGRYNEYHDQIVLNKKHLRELKSFISSVL